MMLSHITYIFIFTFYISPILCMESTPKPINQESIEKINKKNEDKLRNFFINTSKMHTRDAIKVASFKLDCMICKLEIEQKEQTMQNPSSLPLLLPALENADKAKQLKEYYQAEPNCTKNFYKDLCKIDRLHRIHQLLEK